MGEHVSPKCWASLCTHYSCCLCLGFSVCVSSHKCCGRGKHVGSGGIICATCHACSSHFCVPSERSSGAQQCWGGITHPYGVTPGFQLACVTERVLPFIYATLVEQWEDLNLGMKLAESLARCLRSAVSSCTETCDFSRKAWSVDSGTSSVSRIRTFWTPKAQGWA